MFRNDSEESTESAFASVLNTPADEQPLNFDPIDAKLLAAGAPQVIERLETHMGGMDEFVRKTPRRVSLSRQFSKALEEANKSVSNAISCFLCSSVPTDIKRTSFPRSLELRRSRAYPISRCPRLLILKYCRCTIPRTVSRQHLTRLRT
jgi:hypothetical protein